MIGLVPVLYITVSIVSQDHKTFISKPHLYRVLCTAKSIFDRAVLKLTCTECYVLQKVLLIVFLNSPVQSVMYSKKYFLSCYWTHLYRVLCTAKGIVDRVHNLTCTVYVMYCKRYCWSCSWTHLYSVRNVLQKVFLIVFLETLFSRCTDSKKQF